MTTETPRLVPLNSDAGYYLTLVAVHGRCRCQPDLCFDDVPGCRMCSVLDGEWLCPADPEADYPNPDQVAIEGSPAAALPVQTADTVDGGAA